MFRLWLGCGNFIHNRVTSHLQHHLNGHGKMSVAVRACACNERGSACNARAMRMDPVHVRGICGFLYLSL